MPIIDNRSQHILFGLLWPNVDHVCCGLPVAPKGPFERKNRNPNSQNTSGALARQKKAGGQFHIPGGLRHPGWLCHCSQKHRAKVRHRGPSETFLWQGKLLQLSRLLQIPKMEKNNLCVIVQSSSAFGRSELLHRLNLAASIGSYRKSLWRTLIVARNGQWDCWDIPMYEISIQFFSLSWSHWLLSLYLDSLPSSFCSLLYRNALSAPHHSSR